MNRKVLKERQLLLKSLLSPLLKEWGFEEVRRCLSELAHTTSYQESAEQHREEGWQPVGQPKNTQVPYRKPTATDLATRIEAPEARKLLLLRLAAEFDQKEFLPSVSDVRHFLEMRGQGVVGIKQRQDSFKKILNLVDGMADEELESFVKGGLHSGLSQLGPLSEAIRATGAAVRSGEPPADSDRGNTVPTSDRGGDAAPNTAPQDDTSEGKNKT